MYIIKIRKLWHLTKINIKEINRALLLSFFALVQK